MTSLRERSHLILWTLLFFFIASMTVGGLVGGANILTVLTGKKNTALYVGTIDGESITRREFEYERQIQLNRTINQGGTVNEQTMINAGNNAWNTIIDNYIKEKKIKEMNLTVHSDEVYDFLLQTPPPTFQTNITDAGFFVDDEGKFDLTSYQEAVQVGNIPSELENLLVLWENYLKTWLADRKLRTMYNSLASITDDEVLDDYYKKNINATIDYIYVNPNDIPDSIISISEQELEDEYNNLKEEKYKVDETIDVSYVIYSLPEQNEDSLIYSIEKDSIMNQAFLFSDESKYSNFTDAVSMYNLSVEDTLTLSQALSGNSGIPFNMGNSRKVIRFAFDNEINATSEPFEMKNGIAVFNIIRKNSSSYKDFDDVKESIKRTLVRDLKKDKAKEILSNNITSNDWGNTSNNNEYVNYLSDQTSTLSGSFTSIGRSSQLEGALFSTNKGEISNLVETPSSFLYLKIKNKDEFNQEDFNEKADEIRTQLLSSKKNRGYFDWVNSVKKEIEIDDWRYLIY
tara:strand:+ start:85 stop:1629 length:1545 start_codon:yes stop_codon:yes gene_type:complete